MGKLNIAHHKSYHPYRRDNIERVRRDEEEARRQEAAAEGKMMLADAEARIDLLRQRAGLGKAQSRRQDKDDEASPQPGPSTLTATNGHINFFEDFERQSMPITIRTTTKNAAEETDKGVPLAPSEKDLNPWYSNDAHERNRELQDDRKLRDLARKSVHDPLTTINSQLTSRTSITATTTSSSRSYSSKSDANNGYRSRAPPPSHSPHLPPPKNSTNNSSSTSVVSNRRDVDTPPEVAERINRELSERQRALELIRRKKREMMGSETPSTVHGGMDEGYVYGDQFNRKEVQEAHRSRDKRWDRHEDRGWNRSDSQSRRRR